MRSVNWPFVYFLGAIGGVAIGILLTFVLKGGSFSPDLWFSNLGGTTNVLFMGTDVVYSNGHYGKHADKDAFTGRSDSIMLIRLDPPRNSIAILAIPRDTQVQIAGLGTQKINAANAYGGPPLAIATVDHLLDPLRIDHYVVLNVHGLVELIDELGGITVDIPKRMHYTDNTAKLKIDLDPGPHTLNGTEAMGFVRFRHDGLGDIGRVQRQQLFIKAALDKAEQPSSWVHIPKMIKIAQHYIYTDMKAAELFKIANFVRNVPESNKYVAMLPGRFSGTGDWLVDRNDVLQMVARVTGSTAASAIRDNLKITVIGLSSTQNVGFRIARILKRKGYKNVTVKAADRWMKPVKESCFIAQLGNPGEAEMVRNDLNESGKVLNASVGDLRSAVTIWAGDDLAAQFSATNLR